MKSAISTFLLGGKMKISSVSELRKIIDENEFNFKKRFGQNFLIDDNILNKIVNLADVQSEDLVIEVGPGAGALTQHLAFRAKKVLAYEIDISLKNILDKTLANFDNVEIKYNDFLKSNVKSDVNFNNYKRVLVVANLPYYVTTPIISKIVEDKLDVHSITVMMQKEVADRFLAEPKSKLYNSLSIFINYNFSLGGKFKVSKNVFIPKPDVDSVVISLVSRKEKLVKVLDEVLFNKLVLDAFKHKRKTIKNNLKGYNLKLIEDILKKNGYGLNSRAEEIPIQIYASIANSL